MQISPVAHQIEAIFRLRSFDEPVIDAIKKPCSPHKERSAWFRPGLHLIPPTSKQLVRAEKINSPLRKLQSYRHVRVNLPDRRRALKPVELLRKLAQAIDRDGTTTSDPSGRRRPCEAFSNWRTRTAGTGRLNR